MINAVCVWTGRIWWGLVLTAIMGAAVAGVVTRVRDCRRREVTGIAPPGHPDLDVLLLPEELVALDRLEADDEADFWKAVLKHNKGEQP